ncbi:uncharacterized protein FIBRA_04145 [Fibroporia radiculosa]|uniref:RAM signaling network component n=1 Tax=Fibroporia radiculosa TaxID=599839 RepID=J4H2T2_9APHY|nr:uncharacterized protein FIBRA_04145 [Fibroporia radiculosa]CCM02069.1 predicted protein [Fibroporia radiculosa]
MFSTDVDGRDSSPSFRNGISSPFLSIALSREHIIEALSNSPDNGATLDLAHKGLTDVGESGAEQLATFGQEDDGDATVVRIALAYNRLTTLPMAFALISRLRYLVLRNNNFSVFPDVLTVMPSLEILDISRNKIQRFPREPGTLVNLKVFSIMRNKIQRLPAYLSRFRQLTLFKVDQNPIQWPPKSVLQYSGDPNDSQVMSEWISRVQQWLGDNLPSPYERKMSEDSLQSVSSCRDLPDVTTDLNLSSVPQSSPPQAGLQATALYHARSFSLESDASTYFQLERSRSSDEPNRSSRSDKPNFPLPLQFATVFPASNDTSPARSPDSYYPSDEVSGSEESQTTALELEPSHNSNDYLPHGAHRGSASSNLTVKNSFPDLQLAKLHLNTDRDEKIYAKRSASLVGSYGLSSSHHSPEDPPIPDPTLTHRPAPPMDKERHSYFRRLSALTPLDLAKKIPEDLLALVDAVRGILFGVSQIYETLQHYTVYAIDERLSAVLLKVLDPASVYISQLIGALDRFDSISRKALPPPPVCRTVIESCRDNVTVFGKAVGVLALQLKILATHDDVRYTRQMLLTLYGAMAEIAGSWQAIASRIEVVKPLLWEVRPPPPAKSYATQSQLSRTPGVNGIDSTRTPVSAPAGPSTFLPLDHPRPRPNISPNSPDHGKTRMTRRHAGSFSSKDVEIGKMLPSFIDVPSLTTVVLNGAPPPTPVPRMTRRVATPLGSASLNQTPLTTSTGLHYPDSTFPGSVYQSATSSESHSRQGSQSSLLASSSSVSLVSRLGQIEVPSSTNTLVDKEAISAMRAALDAAPAIWVMTSEILQEVKDIKEDLKHILNKAKEAADRLGQNIDAIQDGTPAADRKPLHDDARGFAKTVIQLSTAMKTHIAAHPLFSTLRTNMVKLTNATEEFIILLHVSSFSPAQTPRPYSPIVAHPSPLGLGDDGKLGTNLSRTRSALPSASSRLAPSGRELPYSALPHQTFFLPTAPLGPFRRDVADDSPVVTG